MLFFCSASNLCSSCNSSPVVVSKRARIAIVYDRMVKTCPCFCRKTSCAPQCSKKMLWCSSQSVKLDELLSAELSAGVWPAFYTRTPGGHVFQHFFVQFTISALGRNTRLCRKVTSYLLTPQDNRCLDSTYFSNGPPVDGAWARSQRATPTPNARCLNK